MVTTKVCLKSSTLRASLCLAFAIPITGCIPVPIADDSEYAFYIENKCADPVRVDISDGESAVRVEDVTHHKSIASGESEIIIYVIMLPEEISISISPDTATTRESTSIIERPVDSSRPDVRVVEGDPYTEYIFTISAPNCP